MESQLNEIEVAALEVLDAWQRVIEVSPDDAMRRLGELVSTGVIRPERLATASTTEAAATQQRLRILLERTGNAALAAKVGQSFSAPGTTTRAEQD